MRLTPACCSSATVSTLSAGEMRTLTGVGATAATMALSDARSGGNGGVNDVRADFGEGCQAPDGVVEVGPSLDEVVGAPGDDESPLRRGDGVTHPVDRIVEVADGLLGIARRVFDPDAGQPVLD